MKLVCSDQALLKDITRDFRQEVSLSDHDSHDEMLDSYHALQAHIKQEKRPASAYPNLKHSSLSSSPPRPRPQRALEPQEERLYR